MIQTKQYVKESEPCKTVGLFGIQISTVYLPNILVELDRTLANRHSQVVNLVFYTRTRSTHGNPWKFFTENNDFLTC